MGSDFSMAAVSAVNFWEEPSIKKIGKIPHPSVTYEVGIMYRGSKSIITASELKASLKILGAYRRYKFRKLVGQFRGS